MIYYIFGDDAYRKEVRLKQLLTGADSHNTRIYTNFEFDNILNDVTTLPFLSDKKTVVIRGALDSKNKDISQKIEEIVSRLSDACDLIFFEQKFPAANTRLAKQLKSLAEINELNVMKVHEVPTWISKKTKELGGSITPPAANLLSIKVGADLVALENEIKKLINYSPVISEESINRLVVSQFNESIFALMDAVAAKNTKKSLELLNSFLEEPDNETYVTSMVAKQVQNLLAVKDLASRKMGESQIASETGLHPFVVKKTMASIKNFSYEDLLSMHRQLLQIDLSQKTGQGDPKVLLTKLLITK